MHSVVPNIDGKQYLFLCGKALCESMPAAHGTVLAEERVILYRLQHALGLAVNNQNHGIFSLQIHKITPEPYPVPCSRPAFEFKIL